MTELVKRLGNARSEAAEVIERIAESESQRLLERLKQSKAVEEETHESLMTGVESELSDRLLSKQVVEKVPELKNLNDTDINALKFDFREACPKLNIEMPPPVIEVRILGVSVAACFGAFLGMLIFGPIFAFVFENRDAGVLVGAPFGAMAVSAVVMWAARRPAIRRMLQLALFAGGVLTIVSMANPFGAMRRFFSGRSKGGGKVKLFFMLILGILVLQLAKPQKTASEKDALNRLRSGIRDWLMHSLDVLTMVAIHTRGNVFESDEDPAARKDKENLRDALGKLSRAKEDKDILFTAQEVIQEYRKMYHEPKKAPQVYTSSLSEEYEPVGMVNEGDEIKCLEEPVYKGVTLVKKGKLTRKRG